MQTLADICQELKLTPEQSATLTKFISELTIELLQSIKDDNVRNFDETIDSLRQNI